MNKQRFSIESSRLVSTPVIVIWLVAFLISAYFKKNGLASLFFFLVLLSLISRIWGNNSLNNITVSTAVSLPGLYPGMQTVVEYTLTNGKKLPLMWMELIQFAHARECIIPDDSFEPCSCQTEEGRNMLPAYKIVFPFVKWYESIVLSTVWTAQRRGLYKPAELLIRSGDGFGLTQVETAGDPSAIQTLAVYPQRVAVDVSPMLRISWDTAAGIRGHMEDISVIRGNREYQPGDNPKHINQRMLARTDESIPLNLYNMVRPIAFLFILDGESFVSSSKPHYLLEDVFEEALSVLSSVITSLFEQGVTCGLCLPVSKNLPAVSLPSNSDRSAAELLYYLAGYDPLHQQRWDEAEKRYVSDILPSCFDDSALVHCVSESSSVWLVTNAPEQLPTVLQRESQTGSIHILSTAQNKRIPGTLSLSSFKKEAL